VLGTLAGARRHERGIGAAKKNSEGADAVFATPRSLVRAVPRGLEWSGLYLTGGAPWHVPVPEWRTTPSTEVKSQW
jgi:hypothetical protein